MNRAFEDSELKRRSFFFVFKYYTVLGEDSNPASWLRYDVRPNNAKRQNHVDITECASVLALSLTESPSKQIQRKKHKGSQETGYIYDTRAPWNLLNIQFYPDDVLPCPTNISTEIFHSGPLAFLASLTMEYRNAVRRSNQLHEYIRKLITPPVSA